MARASLAAVPALRAGVVIPPGEATVGATLLNAAGLGYFDIPAIDKAFLGGFVKGA